MKAEESNIENNAGKMNKFRLALDQVPSAIFIMDKEWNFEYINPEFERLSGFTRKELLHKNIRDTLYKNISGIPESRRGIITNLNEGKIWKGELLTIAKDGSKYWAETTASPYKNEKGEIDGFIVIQHDVTEKKNLEKHIVESEDKYRTLVEYSQDGIAIVQDGHFRFVNNAMCKILGYSPQEFYTMKGDDILHPDCRDTILDIHQKRMDGEISSINYSMKLIAKDGRVVDVEAQSTTFAFEGRPAGYLTVHDVTESQRMQEALQRSERRFRELTEMLPQAIYELDSNNRPLFMNRAGLKMFGLIPGVSQNKEAFEFFSPEDTKKMNEALERESKNIRYENGVLLPFASEPAEYMANRFDGTSFPVIIYGTPIVEDGKVTGSRGIIIDISERKAIETALRESEKKYKTLVENSLDGIMIVKNNRILFANDTYCNMLGYDCEFISKSLATDFIVPEEQDRALALSKRRLKGDNSTIRDSYRLLRSDGKIIECEAYSSVINYEGEIASFFTIHDVTENRRMQKALEEKEELYRTLIEKTQDGVVLTQYRKFFLVNQAFCDILGYTREEIMTMNPIDLLTPEKRDQVLMMHDKRMVGEIDDSMSYIANFTHKSGKILIIEINSSTVTIEGQNLSFVTLRDVTKRNQLQEELERSEQKYRQLTEMLPQTIYELDMQGNITYMNQTGIEKFGISSNGLGIPAFNFIIPEEHEKMRLNMKRSLEENYYTPGNSYTAIRSNGEKFPVMIFASPMKTKDGVIGTRGLILDMTEHEAMENALRESEEKYRELSEMLPQTVFEFDMKSKLTFLNQTGKQMFVVDNLDQGISAFSLIAPEDHERMRFNLVKSLRENIPSRGSIYTAVKTTGERFPVMIFSSPVISNGKALGNRGIAVDLTDHMAMQEAMRESEEKYRQLFKAESDAIFMIDVETGHILDANPAATTIYGYSHEELLLMKNTDVSAEPEKTSEATHKNEKLVLLRYHKKKDNTIFPVELSAGFTTFKDRKIQIVTSRDITHNKQMQDALRESEEKYRTLIEKATDGVVITQNGLLKFANEAMCEMMQYTAEEMLEKSFYDFVLDQDHEQMRQYHTRRMNGEKFNSLYRSHFVRKDRKIITVELNSRTSDYNGHPAAFIIIRDITERLIIEDELKLAKDELEELNKNLEERIKESSDSLTEARTQLIRLQKENLQSQFEVLRQQVNPHFLFNSLNVLTSLIKLEPDLAEKFTEHLSKVYRYVLENKDNDLVDLKTELDFLDAYLFLLNIRFMGKIAVTINIESDKTEMLILPLALQLLIENAIKHNSMSKKAPLRIDLFIDANNFLNVVNNLQERESYIASTGVGLKNIEHRYQLLEMQAPLFIKTEESFIAKIPLKENNKS